MTEEAPSTSSGNSQSSGSKVDGIKIILPTYDGATDPKTWLRQLEKIQKAKQWNDKQLIVQAPLLLKDRADDFWETIENDVKDWKTFKEKFSHEFGERKTVGEHLSDLTRISRKTDEPLDVLMGRITKKYQKAFPVADLQTTEEHKGQITERFVKAIMFGANSVDSTLGQHLQIHKADVKEPTVILKDARNLLPRLVQSDQIKPAVCTVTPDSKGIHQEDLEELEERIVDRLVSVLQMPADRADATSYRANNNRRSTTNDRSNSNSQQNKQMYTRDTTFKSGSKVCFTCGSSTHFVKSCPYKKACRRCWQEGHLTRECQAPRPMECPLNWGGLGEMSKQVRRQ